MRGFCLAQKLAQEDNGVEKLVFFIIRCMVLWDDD